MIDAPSTGNFCLAFLGTLSSNVGRKALIDPFALTSTATRVVTARAEWRTHAWLTLLWGQLHVGGCRWTRDWTPNNSYVRFARARTPHCVSSRGTSVRRPHDPCWRCGARCRRRDGVEGDEVAESRLVVPDEDPLPALTCGPPALLISRPLAVPHTGRFGGGDPSPLHSRKTRRSQLPLRSRDIR
jgi:hypothetical protein